MEHKKFTPPNIFEFAVLLSILCWMEYHMILHPVKMRAVLQQISSIEKFQKKNTKTHTAGIKSRTCLYPVKVKNVNVNGLDACCENSQLFFFE